MSTKLQWNGHNIQINLIPSPKYLWFASETILLVDGIEVARSGGFKLSSKIISKFLDKDRSVEICLELKSDIVTLVSVPYKLQIDGDTIAQGRADIDNWISTLVIAVMICSFIACPTCLMTYSLLQK